MLALVVNLYRQGGNLPFFRRLPFMRGEGFTPPNQVEYNEVNLDQLARFQAGSCRFLLQLWLKPNAS